MVFVCLFVCLFVWGWGVGGRTRWHRPNQFWKDTVNQMSCCSTHVDVGEWNEVIDQYLTDKTCDQLQSGRRGGRVSAIIGMAATACNEARQRCVDLVHRNMISFNSCRW